jgi:hypothetical protein
VPPAPAERGFLGRLGMTARFELSTLPFLVGLKKPAAGFRNLDRGTQEISA